MKKFRVSYGRTDTEEVPSPVIEEKEVEAKHVHDAVKAAFPDFEYSHAIYSQSRGTLIFSGRNAFVEVKLIAGGLHGK